MDTEYAIIPLPAFNDNYIWLMRRGDQAAVVDPGDAQPVLAYLDSNRLRLCAILITHHHGDHVGGVHKLLEHFPVPVFGPSDEPIEELTHLLKGGDEIELPLIGTSFDVLAVPGHTRAHIAYYDRKHSSCGALFCGDTLFACGCGRIFEGTPAQMRRSLAKLADLPASTRVYCAHEYTQSNVRFALAVEPDNPALMKRCEEVTRLRDANHPTVPSTIGMERDVNPFLRWSAPSVIAAARRISGKPVDEPDDVFTAIREWKNRF